MQQKKDVPVGIVFTQKVCGITDFSRKENIWSQALILLLTFIIYTCYHATRKPLSVVKNVFTRNCSQLVPPSGFHPNNTDWCHWAPFDGSDSKSLLGLLDSSFLFAYAFAMFGSGFVAERMNLRYFLSVGLIMSGLSCYLLGLARTYEIHSLWYFIIVQIFGGIFQTTGWPSVVTIMGNWFGERKNGIIFGIWNSNTSVGNILGTLLASYFVEKDWALSFIVPGVIMAAVGVITFFFMIPEPVQHKRIQRSTFMEPNTSFYGMPSEDTTDTGTSDISTSNDENTHSDNKEGRTEVRPILANSSLRAVGFIEAFSVPGVIEFSLCLFFAKLVSYTFLYWLPLYIMSSTTLSATKSADISTLFDVGGIGGGIIAGALSDASGMSAFTCCAMLLLSVPMLYIYYLIGGTCLSLSITLLLITGALVNGPYALITTAVSAKLGLEGNKKSLSTITSIIDGTGSIGAAVGPLLAGFVSTYFGWEYVFYMLMISDVIAMLMLVRLTQNELAEFFRTHAHGWTS